MKKPRSDRVELRLAMKAYDNAMHQCAAARANFEFACERLRAARYKVFTSGAPKR